MKLTLGDINKKSFNGDLNFESVVQRNDFKAWCAIIPACVDVCNLKDTIVGLETKKSIMIVRWNPYICLYVAESLSDLLKEYTIKTSQGVELTEKNISEYMSKSVVLNKKKGIFESKFYKLLFLVKNKSIYTYARALVNTEKGREVMVKDASDSNYQWNRISIQEFILKYDYSSSIKFKDLVSSLGIIPNNAKPASLSNDSFAIETFSTESTFGGEFTTRHILEVNKVNQNIILSNPKMELAYKNDRFGYWVVYDGIDAMGTKSKVYAIWTGQNNYLEYNGYKIVI